MDQAQPFFTIVTPVYRGLAFLESCVQSVQNQTFCSYEHLLIDDGSPDESGLLCDQLAARDSHVRSLHKQNGGVTSARNLGIAQAQGRYLLFLDQDDRLAPCALEAIHGALEQAGEDLVSWWKYNVWSEMCQTAAQAVFCRYPLEQFDLLYGTGTVHYVWTKAFDLTFIRSQGLCFDESIQDGTDDLPFVNAYCHAWFSAHPTGGFLYCRSPLYYYETANESSVSNRPQPFVQSHLRMFTDLLGDMNGLYGVPKPRQAAVWRQMLHTLAYGIYSTPPARRSALRSALLRNPQVVSVLDDMKRYKVYSPFYLPYRLGSTRLICSLFHSFSGSRHWYWRAEKLGYCLLGGNWNRT